LNIKEEVRVCIPSIAREGFCAELNDRYSAQQNQAQIEEEGIDVSTSNSHWMNFDAQESHSNLEAAFDCAHEQIEGKHGIGYISKHREPRVEPN